MPRPSRPSSPRQPFEQIAHDRLLHGAGLIGDDELLDAERSAEIERADAVRVG
jgi:hypothetical protein